MTKEIKKVRKAVFPVAGLGTRFLPATKVLPKEMLILGDKPLVQHAFEEAREAGIEEFIFVSSKSKNMLEDHFKTHSELAKTLERKNKHDLLASLHSSNVDAGKLNVTYQDQPLGLGHAIWCAKDLIGNEPFAIILPDDVVMSKTGCMKQMVEAYDTVGGNLVAVVDVPREETSKYGILAVGREEGLLTEVRGMVEKPAPEKAPSTLSIIGRYILQPEIFDYLSSFEMGAGGEIQLTDAMARLIGTQPFHGFRYEGRRFDCGNYMGLFEASVAYALNDNRSNVKAKKVLEDLLRVYG